MASCVTGVWCWRLAALIVAISVGGWSGTARAYRPFDGTDADVAEQGEIEVELGPAQFVREGSDRALVAPSMAVNYGFAPGWEGVIEAEAEHGLSAGGSHLADPGIFLKTVLLPGTLQGQTGPSVAAEFGALLPELSSEAGTGASVALIVSQQWSAVTLHFNAEAAVSRQHHAEVTISLIAEGPRDWPVRPVAELLYERDFGQGVTRSVLAGAIWRVHENLAAFRAGRTAGSALNEVRAGLTFSF